MIFCHLPIGWFSMVSCREGPYTAQAYPPAESSTMDGLFLGYEAEHRELLTVIKQCQGR